MTAGYSGTPLPRKLGIKPETRIAFHDLPDDVRSQLEAEIAKCRMVTNPSEPVDFAMIFVESADALRQDFKKMARRLAPAGMLWVSWPKKTSALKTDLNENIVREIGLDTGLVDVKVCAVNETWSGLKFVIRLKDRQKL